MTPEEAANVLGIPIGASEKDIKTAYRQKVSQEHPDKGGDPERFKLFGKAKDTLLNPAPQGVRIGPGAPFGNQGPNISKMFNMFAQQMGGIRQKATTNVINYPLKITLKDFLSGGKHEVKITDKTKCSNCKLKCSKCGGSGQVLGGNIGGWVTTMSPCTFCDTLGFTNQGCHNCGNEGICKHDVVLEVTLPAGCESPTQHVLSSGNVVKIIPVVDMEGFRVLSDKTLFVEVQVGVLELLCGTSVNIAHPEGAIKFEADITKLIHKINGKGINKGMLVVRVLPQMPKTMPSDELRKAIQEELTRVPNKEE